MESLIVFKPKIRIMFQEVIKIFFDHLDGFTNNLTNQQAVIARNFLLKLSITKLLMGEGQISTGLTLNLMDQAVSNILNVRLGLTNAILFNPILRPLTKIEDYGAF